VPAARPVRSETSVAACASSGEPIFMRFSKAGKPACQTLFGLPRPD
jgi:hypothetical protein